MSEEGKTGSRSDVFKTATEKVVLSPWQYCVPMGVCLTYQSMLLATTENSFMSKLVCTIVSALKITARFRLLIMKYHLHYPPLWRIKIPFPLVYEAVANHVVH